MLIVVPFLSVTLFVAERAACAASPASSRVTVEHFEPEPIIVSLDDVPSQPGESANKKPEVVAPPENAVLRVPAGFDVNLFAADVPQARWLAMTPDGHVVCSSGRTNQVFLLTDTDDDGVADERTLFLDAERGANLPFGMDFAQVDGQWFFYLGNTDAVLRYPYRAGQTELGSDFVKITELPGEGYNQHWTRNVRVSPSGEELFVTVGSQTDHDAESPPRASVLRMKLDGSQRVVFASGLRNPIGLDFHPATGEPYVNVNERDKLGDELVPDYFTRIEQGQFFGWPYAYLTPQHLDPRRVQDGQSERPDLVAQTVTPDVLLQAHSAALGLAFCRGDKFPAKYRGGAFGAFRGSSNRNPATGYKLVFVPFNDEHRPEGYYEDFVTGFLLDPAAATTWGRPVGVIFAPDGSLLFTEESHGRIYRVSYSG
jgi:glucose/arabinose dehydrogenase